MKKSSLFCLAVLSLCATGCSEMDLVNEQSVTSVISATMEGVKDTRSHATDDGKFTWSAGDEISVYTSGGTFCTYTLKGEGGTSNGDFTGTLLGGVTKSTCAVYPDGAHIISGNTLTFDLPDEYGDYETAYVADTRAAMLSMLDASNPNKFSFKHLGGVLRFKFKNVPAHAAQFVFTADKDIAGGFSADLSAATPTIETTENTGANSVTIKFQPEETSRAEMTVFVPMPIGEYSTFTIAFQKQDGTELVSYTHKPSTPNVITRRLLARFPEIAFDDVNADLEGEGDEEGDGEDNEQEPGTLVNGVATLAEAGTLASVLGEQMLTLTSLKVVGEINGTDIKCLRQMLDCAESLVYVGDGTEISRFENPGFLADLDLSEASIIAGGDVYFTYSDSRSNITPTVVSLTTNNNELGDYMFSYSSYNLESILIPKNTVALGEHVFHGCTYLDDVTIPDAVTTIGAYAFSNCSFITNVIIPSGVTTIEEHTFSFCTSLMSVTIPIGVTTIEDYAFYQCYSLHSVTIPEGVTTIGKDAFYSASLNSIVIPSSVTTISTTFGLHRKDIYISDLAAWCNIEDAVNIPISNLYLNGELITDLVIPDGVTTIRCYAFYECSSITSVIIPKGVTTIDAYAFKDCSSITSVTIPEGVRTIQSNSFIGCSLLTNVTIPDGVRIIGGLAFKNCYSLTSVTIPDDVKTIETQAFNGCDKLADVYCYATNPPNQSQYGSEFSNKIKDFATLHVPNESLAQYKGSWWNEYFTNIVGMEE